MSLTILFLVPASSRPPRLPPLQISDNSPDSLHPSAITQLNATFGQDTRYPPPSAVLPSTTSRQSNPGKGPVPKFQKLKSIHELQPHINAQPPYRRANPEGGFISVSPTGRMAGLGHFLALI